MTEIYSIQCLCIRMVLLLQIYNTSIYAIKSLGIKKLASCNQANKHTRNLLSHELMMHHKGINMGMVNPDKENRIVLFHF